MLLASKSIRGEWQRGRGRSLGLLGVRRGVLPGREALEHACVYTKGVLCVTVRTLFMYLSIS